jgi:hypothetical protein
MCVKQNPEYNVRSFNLLTVKFNKVSIRTFFREKNSDWLPNKQHGIIVSSLSMQGYHFMFQASAGYQGEYLKL